MSSSIEDLNDDECQEPCCDDTELTIHAENRRVWEDNERLRARVAARNETDALRAEIERLRTAITNAPREAARRGELTYECNVKDPCKVCEWRRHALEVTPRPSRCRDKGAD